MEKLNKKLTKLIITAALLLPMSNSFANHPIQIDAQSSDTAQFSNVTSKMQGDSINITGELSGNSKGHMKIPGKIKLELLDGKDAILKTILVPHKLSTHKRHKHRANKTYIFNKNIAINSLHVVKVRVSQDTSGN
ncbi:MAG: hypothetical protein ACC653_02030 [Gammaproteobacteria bacterium]